MYVQQASAKVWRAPLIQPFRTSRGQHNNLENVLLTLEFSDGTKGFGEAAVATHLTGETVGETFENLRSVARDLVGHDIDSIQQVSRKFQDKLSRNHSALAALEMAVLDAFTKRFNQPLWKLFGRKVCALRTDMTIVLGTIEESVDFAKRAYERGFRFFKIKIGGNFEEDFKRVLAVRKSVKESRICLDANQAFRAIEAIRFLDRLRENKITPALIEQPVLRDDWDGLAEVKRKTKIPVIADESVFSVSDVKKLIKKKAAHGINIKLMKSGILGACEIARLAKKAGLKLMIGSMMETPLATTTAAHLAGALGGFDYVDLDPVYFIKKPVTSGFNPSSDGIYNLRKVRSGIGVKPS